MTEKEKMLAGKLYFPNAEELVAERAQAKEWLFTYNHCHPSDSEGRRELLSRFLGKVGKQFLIEQPFYCDYGYNIEIGENFYANVGCTILDGAGVSFGNDVLLAPHVAIYTAGHPSDAYQRAQGLEYASPVVVGNRVWIGGNAVVLPGVTIGDNVIIGAGSVVTKDIPENVLAVGNPCRVVKNINI